ncbi:hypothetical protein [Pseudomonas sp. UV AK001]|uniref:hypothetical protein n=1 Tax=Pseudomonas sp. UV AK001 TaxID=3384791 RepID=UPI0038D44D10
MDFSKELKNSKSSGHLTATLSDGQKFHSVLVDIIPTATGAILIGVNATDNVRLDQPKLSAGTHTVKFGENHNAWFSLQGESFESVSGEMKVKVDGQLTAAEGIFNCVTNNGLEVSGEFNIQPVKKP